MLTDGVLVHDFGMAEQQAQDEIKGTLSVGGSAPVDVSAASHSTSTAQGDEGSEGGISQAQVTAHSSQPAPAPTLPQLERLTNVAGDSSSDDANSAPLSAADVAVGSDTESRADSTDVGKSDPAGHERSNSITAKKLTSFKSVSVTKNFLAKSAATTAPPVKASSEKGMLRLRRYTEEARMLTTLSTASTGPSPSPVPQAGLRPRLVAKSGNNARPIAPGPGYKAAGGPDASKVWNRNQRRIFLIPLALPRLADQMCSSRSTSTAKTVHR